MPAESARSTFDSLCRDEEVIYEAVMGVPRMWIAGSINPGTRFPLDEF
jgi:hypothetical protein